MKLIDITLIYDCPMILMYTIVHPLISLVLPILVWSLSTSLTFSVSETSVTH